MQWIIIVKEILNWLILIHHEDYKAFSTEQIKFKDDAVYMIVY